MAICYSYLRFSTKRQADGDSYRRQSDALAKGRKWAEANGFHLAEDYQLEDLGISAFRRKNFLHPKSALKLFLDDVKAGRVPVGSVLIVESLDRLSRADIDEALNLFLSIIRAGVGIKTFSPDRLYTKEELRDNPFVALMEPLTIFYRANEESATKSKRLREVFQEKRDQADSDYFAGRVPAWVERGPDDGPYRLIPEKAATVRLIFDLALTRIGVPKILKKLHAEKVAPLGKRGRWSSSYVSKILHSRHVLGEFQPAKLVERIVKVGDVDIIEVDRVPDGELRRNHYPRIVDDETFYTVQHIMERRKNVRGRKSSSQLVNIFQGLLFCANDGSPLYLGYGKGRKTKSKPDVRRLSSNAHICREPTAEKRNVSYPELEAAFLRFCREDLPDHTREDEALSSVVVWEGKLQTVDARRKRVQSLVDNEPDPDQMETFLRQLAKMDREYRDAVEGLEKAKATASHRRNETSAELVSLVDRLQDAEEPEILKAQIAGMVRQLVGRIDVLIDGDTKRRVCFVGVRFVDGQQRFFDFSYGLVKGIKPGGFRTAKYEAKGMTVQIYRDQIIRTFGPIN